MFNFLRLNRYTKGIVKYLYLHLAFAIVSNILILTGPLLIGDLVNNITNSSYNILKMSLITGLVYLFGYIGLYISNVFVQIYTAKISTNIKSQAFDTLNTASLHYLDTTPTGDIIQRFTTDSDLLHDGISLFYLTFFPGVVTVIFSSIVLLTINFYMALVVFLSAFVIYIYAKTAIGKIQNQYHELKEMEGRMSSFSQDILNNKLLVNAYHYEDMAIDNFKKINDKYGEKSSKAYFLGSINNPTFRLINYFFYTLLGLVYLLLHFNNVFIQVGTFLSVLIYANMFARPFNEFSNLTNQFLAANASYRRILTLIIEKEDSNQNIETKGKISLGEVEFRNLSFSYERNKELIKNFNLVVKPGEKVAIVGHTGSGKTTIINLLLRFYDSQSGDILIDGYPINKMDIKELRNNIGLVLQEPWLFHQTIFENITYGTKNMSLDDVVKVSKIVGVHHFIMMQKEGYNTIVSDAEQISEGQKQLITLARALIKNPKILVLDEATSQIDSLMERDIQNAFGKATKGKTTFVIAHRLKTIVDSDHIILMSYGKIIEQGNHDQLMELKENYYKLYMSQFVKESEKND